MSPETMVYELQIIWNKNTDYSKEDFIEWARAYINENETTPFSCVFDEKGFAYPVDDYVISCLNFNR